MRKKTIVLIAGVLIAAGGVAAVAVAGVGDKRGRFGDGPGMGAMLAHMGGHGLGFGRGGGLKALDADNDGAITIDEALAKRAPVFDRIDTNSDGVIDAQEIQAEVNLNVEYWRQAMLSRLDKDGDGKISKDEFGDKDRRSRRAERADGDDEDRGRRGRGWHGHRHGWHGHYGGERRFGGWGERGSARSFEKLDLNSDGFVDASEIETGIKPRMTRRVSKMVRRFDQDNDGRVTREEFEKPTRDRFAVRDINKDGRITEEDLPPMMRGRGILR